MNCCNEAGHCTQGEGCAIRRANETPFIREHTVRRYRAGEPAKVELPPLPIDVAEDDDGLRWHDWLWIGVVVAMILYLLAEIVFGLGLI